jgi:NtrC-family two-component system sensor histidine kinase KinB
VTLGRRLLVAPLPLAVSLGAAGVLIGRRGGASQATEWLGDWGVLLVAALLAALGLAATLRLSWKALRSVRVIAGAVGRLAEGDFAARVMTAADDDLAVLGRDLNRLAEVLTETQRLSTAMGASAERALRATIASLPDPVVVFDPGGVVLLANPAARAALGLGGRAAPETALAAALAPHRAHVMAGKGVLVPRGFDEALVLSGSEGPRHWLPRAAPVYDEAGTVSSVLIVLQDVTRLAHAAELADDLVATTAHELKTPLTSLRMAVHLCLEGMAGPLSEKQEELLYAARQDCERIQSLVDEILDLARIQSGRVPLRRQALAPEEVVATAVTAHRAAAERRSVTLVAEALPDCPEVLADRERVDLVLANLISNALRHTPAGGHVVVSFRATGESVRFDVADDGAGIPAEHLARIFDRFYQVPGRERGGSGLGLTLAKEIVEAQGGSIGVESAPGRGSRFHFTLPVIGAMP